MTMQCVPDTIESASIHSSLNTSNKMQPLPATPQETDANEGENAPQSPLSDRESTLMQELAHERQQRARAESALGLFCQGVHLLTLQMKESDLNNDECSGVDDAVIAKYHDDDHTVQTLTETVSSEGDDYSLRSSNRGRTWSNNSAALEDFRLAELTGKLSSNQGGVDLMALQNAAHMVLEHARLASQEASIVVRDTQLAQSQAEQYQQRALLAEKENVVLVKANKSLNAQVQKLTAERRVLIKEVRSLRKELKTSKTRGMMEQLERYVAGALTAHEYNLKCKTDQAKRDKAAADEAVAYMVPADKASVNEVPADKSIDESSEKDPKQETEPKSQPKAACVTPKTNFLGGHVALGFGFASSIGKKFQPPTPPKPAAVSNKKEPEEVKTPYQPVKFDLCTPSASYDMTESDLGSNIRHFFSMQSPSGRGRGSPLLDLNEVPVKQCNTPTTLNANHFEKCANTSVQSIESAACGTLLPAAMPCNVSFHAGEDSVKSQLPSPSVTPLASPDSIHLELPEDPRILRSLALPLVEETRL
jgi:hypothetical protein